MKRLMILRHAKSDWNAAYGSDHDRPLNDRGTAAARAMGVVVARCGEVPDLVITSSARRARDTLDQAAASGGWDSRVDVSDALYGTSPRGALDVASGAPEDVRRLMLVGHQPTWGALVRELTGAAVVIKTATLVAIDLTTATWAEAARARGAVAYVLQPKLFTRDGWSLGRRAADGRDR